MPILAADCRHKAEVQATLLISYSNLSLITHSRFKHPEPENGYASNSVWDLFDAQSMIMDENTERIGLIHTEQWPEPGTYPRQLLRNDTRRHPPRHRGGTHPRTRRRAYPSNFLTIEYMAIDALDATFSECLVPYWGISSTMSAMSTMRWSTPFTSLPTTRR